MTLLWIAATLSVTKNRPYYAQPAAPALPLSDDDDWLILHITGRAWK